MRHNHLVLTSFLSIIIIILGIASASDTNETSIASFVNSTDFWQQVTVAAVGALLAFLFTFVLSQISERRKPRKQLSYDIDVKRELIKVEKNVESKVKILYNGKEIEDILHIACNIKNTGKKVIKNEFIRFEFPKGTNIIDFYFDPKPQRELDVSEIKDNELETHEMRFKIGHIEHGQQIGLRFLTSGNSSAFPNIHFFNDEGDVEFIPGSIRKLADERIQITRFIQLYLLFLFVPSIFSIFSKIGYPVSQVSNLASGIAVTAILISMIPVIRPFSQAIANLVLRLSRQDDEIARQTVPSIIVNGSTHGDINIKSYSSDSNEA
jgi:hypothetical protein